MVLFTPNMAQAFLWPVVFTHEFKISIWTSRVNSLDYTVSSPNRKWSWQHQPPWAEYQDPMKGSFSDFIMIFSMQLFPCGFYINIGLYAKHSAQFIFSWLVGFPMFSFVFYFLWLKQACILKDSFRIVWNVLVVVQAKQYRRAIYTGTISKMPFLDRFVWFCSSNTWRGNSWIR